MPATMASMEVETHASLPWVLRLRCLCLAAQVVALVCARAWFGVRAAGLPLALSLVLLGVANTVVAQWLKRAKQAPQRPVIGRAIGALLAFDTLVLTVMLALAGGAMNPFTVLYLVQITLAALVLDGAWTLAITGLSLVGYASLYFVPSDARQMAAENAHFAQHLRGMWLAFSLATALIAYFVRRIAKTIAEQRERIASLRESAARNARLAAITTLAAGAAHELGSPLGTIAVAAHEIELAARHSSPLLEADARLIAREAERCHDILAKMASRAGGSSECCAFDLFELERRLRERLTPERERHLRVRPLGAPSELMAPLDELVQSLHALINNAFDASPEGSAVVLSWAGDARGLSIAVEDAGCGMSSPVLARAGEPFFTTKDPGRGLGLGLFLTRAFAESQGGELLLESELGSGTRATLRLPIATAERA